jgi:hypothetical protein
MLSNLKIGIRLGIGFAIAAVAAARDHRSSALPASVNCRPTSTTWSRTRTSRPRLANDIIDNVNSVGRFHRNMLIVRN